MLKPMLASLADAPLDDPRFVYEPKYDGIRAIAEVPAGAARVKGRSSAPRRVRLWSRLGNEKTSEFPDITAALEQWALPRTQPVVLDGEIVATDARGMPVGFQQLQGRHRSPSTRVAFVAFDLLRDGATDLLQQPLLARRAALERAFARTRSPVLRISEMVRGNGRELYARAIESGWEGLVAKRASSVYRPGRRTPDWRKLKIVREQEFVIAGWTEPRQSRACFGALLLGIYTTVQERPRRLGGGRTVPPTLVYVGHTGTGFSENELARVMRLLRPLKTSACPFHVRPRTNERPHWVEPKLVAQIKFGEWTTDNKLRHPVYLGLRDDKKPKDVKREVVSRLHASSRARIRAGERTRGGPIVDSPNPQKSVRLESDRLLEQLRALEESRRAGTVDLPDGDRLSVTNLSLIRFGGHVPKGGYDVPNGSNHTSAVTPAIQ